MKAKLKVEIALTRLKIGEEVEIEHQGFDEVYKEKIYKIIGYNLWLPESELEIYE